MELQEIVLISSSKMPQKTTHLSTCDLSPVASPVSSFFLPSARLLAAPSQPRALAASYSAIPACFTSAKQWTGVHSFQYYRLVLLTALFPGLAVSDIAYNLLCGSLPVLQLSTKEGWLLLACRTIDAFLRRMKSRVGVLRHSGIE